MDPILAKELEGFSAGAVARGQTSWSVSVAVRPFERNYIDVSAMYSPDMSEESREALIEELARLVRANRG